MKRNSTKALAWDNKLFVWQLHNHLNQPLSTVAVAINGTISRDLIDFQCFHFSTFRLFSSVEIEFDDLIVLYLLFWGFCFSVCVVISFVGGLLEDFFGESEESGGV
jgi:hypothetical protein